MKNKIVKPESEAVDALQERKTVKDWLSSEHLKTQIMQALPKHCTIDRFMRVLFTAMQRTPKLMLCTKESLFSAFITCSQYGIEPDGRRAHLIPYNNSKNINGKWVKVMECQIIIDYKGLSELILRSGKVSYLHADVVCENDTFKYNKGQLEEHQIDFRKPRGEVYAAYALVRFKDETEKTEVMTFDEIEGIRNRSKAGKDGPWTTDWNEMAKKTVFRRLSKWLPLSPEEKEVIELDDNQFSFKEPKQAIPVSDLSLGDSIRQLAGEDSGLSEKTEESESEPTHREILMMGLAEEGINLQQFFNWGKTHGHIAKDAESIDDVTEKQAERMLNGWDSIKGSIKSTNG